MAAKTTPPLVPAGTARRLLLAGQGLLADPARRATPAAVHRQIERMGFVQVDTINIIERAHHHILHSRFDGYRPPMLARLLERDRKLFEHWTHDASVIPAAWLPQWRFRFERYRRNGLASNPWWARRMGGEPKKVIAHVRRRVRDEGPLMSRDFEHDGTGAGPWWGWKPQKAALEFLWRTGDLSVAARVNFHKVYDLTDRVFPDLHRAAVPSAAEHLDWACRSALDRLVVATASELASFFDGVSAADARRWAAGAARRGEIEAVVVEAVDGSRPRAAWAWPDWRRRAVRTPDPPDRMRLLSPFDPVLRDRKRAERLFGFEYRFEAFVPAPKRLYGYYVLPVLEGESLVARLDARLERRRGELQVLGLWWERDVKATRRRRTRLTEAVGRFAEALGAERVVLRTVAAPT